MDKQSNYLLTRYEIWTPELDRLLRKWKKQIGRKEQGHREVSRSYEQRHYIFGLPTIILLSIVSSGQFATFNNCDDGQSCDIIPWIRLTSALLTLLSGGLAAGMTFLNYQKRAEHHKTAADAFGESYREIDSMLQIPGYARGDPVLTLQNIRSQYDNNVRNAPELPKRYYIELTYEVKPSDQELLNDSVIDIEDVHNTDSEHEVCIPIDLDEVPQYDPDTVLKAVVLESRRREQEQKSLNRRLLFELERLNDPSNFVRKKKSSDNRHESAENTISPTRESEKKN